MVLKNLLAPLKKVPQKVQRDNNQAVVNYQMLRALLLTYTPHLLANVTPTTTLREK